MATNEQIKLDIVSGFDPGGFSKADKAVKGLGQTMNRQGEAVNKVITAFGSANSEVGKFAKGAQNLMGAFAGGGIWGLAAAGVAILVTKFMEAREAAAKMAEEQRKAWRDDLVKKANDGLTALRSRHSEIADEIERGAKAAERIAKAYEGLAKSEVEVSNTEAELTVTRLEGAKQTKLAAEKDPVKRKQIELEFERQIFEVRSKAAQIERNQKAWVAGEQVKGAEGKLATEKEKFANLLAKKESLEAEIETTSSSLGGFAKKNPIPTEKDFERTRTQGSGSAMGVGGNIVTYTDTAGLKSATDKWNEDNAEFQKPLKDALQKNIEELSQVMKGIADAPSVIRVAELEASQAGNRMTSVEKSNADAVDRERIQQTALSEKQIAFDKTLEDYKKALDARVDVEEKITRQEEKIERLKEKEMTREQKRSTLLQQQATTSNLGAQGWNQQQTDAEDAEEAKEKANQKEAKWVKDAKRRRDAGAKLGEKEERRIKHFEKFDEAQGFQEEKKDIDDIKDRIRKGFFVSKKDRERIKPFDEKIKQREAILDPAKFDPADAAKNQLTALNNSLNELKGLRTDLQNSLKVN